MINMRRLDRSMNKEDALNMLKKEEFGILATVDDNGQPYGVPLNYVVVDNYIYCHGNGTGGSKLNNIKNNNKVSFSVVGKTKVLPDKFGTLYESVIIFGEADLVTDEKEKIMVFREFLMKYCSDFIEEGERYIKSVGHKAVVVKITIKSLSGKNRV